MANTAEEYAGMTDDERAALAELDEMYEGASDDDEVVGSETGRYQGPQSWDLAEEERNANADEDDFETDPPADETQQAPEREEEDPSKDVDDTDTDADDEPAKPKQPEPEAPQQQAQPPVSSEFQYTPPAELTQQLADLDAQSEQLADSYAEKIAELARKYDEGELTEEERTRGVLQLQREERTEQKKLRDQMLEVRDYIGYDRANAINSYNQAIAARDRTIEDFLKEVSIPRDENDLRYSVLDRAVRQVAASAEGANLNARQTLEAAYDRCVQAGLLLARNKGGKTAQRQRQNVPPTLAGIPASNITETSDGGRFAYINRIKDPDARELAFNSLSPADQEAYLTSGM